MKVYVDFKDLDAEDMPSNISNKYNLQVRSINGGSEYRNVELVSLADYTNQVRKEVCEQVKTELLDISHEYWRVFKQNGKQYMTSDDIAEYLDVILDQIQKK
jgi:hypothetical protein